MNRTTKTQGSTLIIQCGHIQTIIIKLKLRLHAPPFYYYSRSSALLDMELTRRTDRRIVCQNTQLR